MTASGKYDSLIFDMDGTLWDAVDSYIRIWDVTIEALGIQRAPVTRDELNAMMGLSIDEICRRLLPELPDQDTFLRLLDKNEREMMPILGGVLYPDVKLLMPELSKEYQIFMVSNCGSEGLHNFVQFSGLEECITDTLTFGETLKGKAHNIHHIIDKHNLRRPLYIGDTQSDSNAAHAAGVDMGWVTYGFGTVDDAEISFNSFSDLYNKLTQKSV